MSVRLGCRFYLFLCVCIFLIVLECLVFGLLCVRVAVSYTHLDVYKRQAPEVVTGLLVRGLSRTLSTTDIKQLHYVTDCLTIIIFLEKSVPQSQW